MNSEDEKYMRRCLQLAKNGRQNAKPNPMVGAVIVAPAENSMPERIIGEGYHVRCGEGHAEVNAFASVRPEDEQLLPKATMYVSLEPCSHYGKTPPCADLIIRKGIPAWLSAASMSLLRCRDAASASSARQALTSLSVCWKKNARH